MVAHGAGAATTTGALTTGADAVHPQSDETGAGVLMIGALIIGAGVLIIGALTTGAAALHPQSEAGAETTGAETKVFPQVFVAHEVATGVEQVVAAGVAHVLQLFVARRRTTLRTRRAGVALQVLQVDVTAGAATVLQVLQLEVATGAETIGAETTGATEVVALQPQSLWYATGVAAEAITGLATGAAESTMIGDTAAGAAMSEGEVSS